MQIQQFIKRPEPSRPGVNYDTPQRIEIDCMARHFAPIINGVEIPQALVDWRGWHYVPRHIDDLVPSQLVWVTIDANDAIPTGGRALQITTQELSRPAKFDHRARPRRHRFAGAFVPNQTGHLLACRRVQGSHPEFVPASLHIR
ncbi:MAG TPA: hypothetical protein EYQ31_08385 [Candidatus Handelsmanbacteria bacterium]|nr:hypothetical protein [Candidatus Handelsmanbacteria bacterium]